MTTLTLESKYVDILRPFGNIEEIVNELVRHYALERVNQRLDQAKQEIATLEAKYGMTYEEFHERVAVDEVYVTSLNRHELMWERDLNTWEFYTEDLAEWLGRLNSISKLSSPKHNGF